MDKPDVCFIDIGRNNLGQDQSHEIAKEIVNIVKLCHNHDVNDVFVSGIPLRIGKEEEVYDVNIFLQARTFLNDFIMIDNSNTTRSHIARDNIHLNNNGTWVIANNFVRAINRSRSD